MADGPVRRYADMDCAACGHSIHSHVHIAPHPCVFDECDCAFWVWQDEADEYVKYHEGDKH